MAKLRENTRCVEIELSDSDISDLRDGDAVTVECPHTGKTIYVSRNNAQPYECECCGQMIEPDNYITPSVSSSTVDRIESGGTIRYGTAHDEDITIYMRGKWDAVGGWL